MFHVTHFVTTQISMNYKLAKTTCKCGNPRRPTGRYCTGCHAKKQREYRQEMKKLAEVSGTPFANAVKDFKRKLLLNSIKAEDGNLCRAAIRLGVHRNTIAYLMRELSLNKEQIQAYVKGLA